MKNLPKGNIENKGQLHIRQDNIDQLAPFELHEDNLEQAITNAATKN